MRHRWLSVVLLVHFVNLTFSARASDKPTPIGRWRAAAPMHERREYAGGVRLDDGRILAVSGHPLEGKSIASAELYDWRGHKWTSTGSLRQPRNSGNSATRLPDGRVLLAGGHSNDSVISGAELYDPATGKWTDAGSLSVGRDPMATLLADGRVLVTGGINWYINEGKVYDVAELYDPTTGEWTATGSLLTPRNQHRVALLDDGRVLAVAGYAERGVPMASAELYDPTTGRWQATEALPSPRAWFGQVKLHDGRILVVGGYTGSSSKPSNRAYLASAVLYDPKTERWRETRPMQEKRAGASVTLLGNGQVLVAGGVAESGKELKSAEVFDPRTESWLPAAPMNTARRNHRATLLQDGSVLVIGGSNHFGNQYLTSCEIFSF